MVFKRCLGWLGIFNAKISAGLYASKLYATFRLFVTHADRVAGPYCAIFISVNMLLSIRKEVLKHDNLKILKTVNDKVTVFCSICGKSFSASKTNHVPDHLKGLSHVKAVQLRKGQQSNLITTSGPKRARIEDEDHTLSNDNVKDFLQKYYPECPKFIKCLCRKCIFRIVLQSKKTSFFWHCIYWIWWNWLQWDKGSCHACWWSIFQFISCTIFDSNTNNPSCSKCTICSTIYLVWACEIGINGWF